MDIYAEHDNNGNIFTFALATRSDDITLIPVAASGRTFSKIEEASIQDLDVNISTPKDLVRLNSLVKSHRVEIEAGRVRLVARTG
jgi:hypothetical protein